MEVVLHGADDARKLREANFLYVAEITDLVRRGTRDRAADGRLRSSTQRAALPQRTPTGLEVRAARKRVAVRYAALTGVCRWSKRYAIPIRLLPRRQRWRLASDKPVKLTSRLASRAMRA